MSRYNAPEWNPKRPQVPVDKDGNWLSYPDWKHVDWKLVQPFYAELEVVGMEVGRSAKRVVLRDVHRNVTYPMFVGDLVDAIKTGLFTVEQTPEGGRIRGTWTASKRGANYGLKVLKE